MEKSDWWTEEVYTKGGWRSVLMEFGGQCVMIPGTTMMHLLSADSLDSQA